MSAIGPGDLVVCVCLGVCDECYDDGDRRLVLGRAYRISEVEHQPGAMWPGFNLVEAPVGPFDNLWCGHMFRKLNDGTDDAELIERIRKCQPIREPANA